MILLSSPGGNLSQATIMGEIIRSRGLVTAVGTPDASGRVKPAYCASACVFVYAGGKTRLRRAGLGAGRSSLCHNQARRATRSPTPSGSQAPCWAT